MGLAYSPVHEHGLSWDHYPTRTPEPLEIQAPFNPNGAYGATYGPFVIIYGPLYRQQNKYVQYAIREHERLHARQAPWGLKDLWEMALGKNSSREIEAYQLSKDILETVLELDRAAGKKHKLCEKTRNEIQKSLNDVRWFLDNPEYMWGG
jgi:hypothetical protein